MTSANTTFELCQELKRLSGWKYHGDQHCIFRNESSPKEQWHNVYRSLETYEKSIEMAERGYLKDLKRVPDYSLEYLLEKLPPYIKDANFEMANFDTAGWKAGYYNGGVRFGLSFDADTPKHAALQLAITLFKEGHLKKGDDA